MKNERMFFKCNICGNIAEMIESSGVTPVCCDKEMTRLIVNTVDASQEKHVPVAKRDGDKLTVTVGSALHPMTPEHHISWIVVAQGSKTLRAALDPTGHPSAVFKVEGDEPITVYEYCNLHGLWAAEA